MLKLLFLKSAVHLDADLEVLANIDESELEALLQDPEFLNLDPNLPPEVRRKMIEDIRLVILLKFFIYFMKFL